MADKFLYHADGSSAPDDRVFVFGSNLSGFHGAGAALAAYKYYGAKLRIGSGLVGRSYAIPTKDEFVQNTLPLDEIAKYVAQFVIFTQNHPEMKFFVTRVGCGLAGLRDIDMAVMFYEAHNCSFPDVWKNILEACKE